MSIQKKITLLNAGGLLLLGLLCMIVTIYYGERNKRQEIANIRAIMLEERKTQLNDLISNAYAVVKSTSFWTDGQRALHSMRFGADGKNYYFVVDKEGVFYVHPDRPELVGKKHIDLEDADGKKIIRDIIRIANDRGEGLIEYRWPKPGTDHPVRMLTAVKLYKDWNWILCAGISMDDIEKAVSLKESELTASTFVYLVWQAAIIMVVLICVLLVSILLSRRISSSIGGSVEKIHGISLQVASASHQVLSSSRSVASNAGDQSDKIKTTFGSLNKIVSSTRRNVADTKAINDHLLRIRQVLAQMNQSMSALDESIKNISTSGEHVSQIIELINNLAFKIKLVALNASVEAARTNVKGNGFSVIAEQIRGMADHSAEAAKSTKVLIEDSAKKIDCGVQQVAVSVKMFHEVMNSVEEVNGLILHIMASSNQQNREVESIHEASFGLEKVIGQNRDLVDESASAAMEMTGYAEQLNSVVAGLVSLVGGEPAVGVGKSVIPWSAHAEQPRLITHKPLVQQS